MNVAWLRLLKMQKMSPSEIVSIVRGAFFTFGVVGVVFVLAFFTHIHWGWMVFIGFVAIGALQNAIMKNIGDGINDERS